MSKRKETGVTQRHTRRCPRKAGSRGYAPHKCTGTWAYVIDVGQDSNGKRKQEMKGGFTSKQDAREARAARLTEVRTRTADAYAMTVGAYLELWLSWKRGLRDSTRLSYRYHLDHYLIPALGQRRMVELERQPQLIEEMFTALTKGTGGQPLSPTSVRRIHATLRSALNTAVKRKLLAHNPALAVELPQAVRRKAVVWTAEQVGAFLDAIEGDRLAVLYQLVVMAGLRRGEAVGLRWVDVDFGNGVLAIRQQVVAVGREVRIGPPKTKAGERFVTLDDTSVAALREHWQRQTAEQRAWGEAWTDTGLVFTREDGTVLRPDFVTHHFRTLIAEAGLPVIRLHDLRHTSASLALAAHVPMKVVSDRLGHSSTQITADLYSHVLPTVARDAAQQIARLVPRRQPAVASTEPDVSAM